MNHRLLRCGISALALLLAAISEPASGQESRLNSQSGKFPLEYSLPDVDGRQHSERELRQSKAAVFIFVGTECPISNRYAPEINRIVSEYSPKGISLFVVYSEPGLEAASGRQHSQEYGYKLPALLDPEQTLASSSGVVATPTALVVSPAGEIWYRGRIDNRYLDFGRYRDAGIEADLRIALDAVVAGKPIAKPFTKVIGCALPPLGMRSTHGRVR
jgi:hypothetical protein